MPVRKITPTVTGDSQILKISDLVELDAALVSALEVTNSDDQATTKSVKVYDERVVVNLPVDQHTGKRSNYTISVMIVREPVTEQEAACVSLKSKASKDRKVEKENEIKQRMRDDRNASQELAVRMARELVPTTKPTSIADQIKDAMATVQAVSSLISTR